MDNDNPFWVTYFNEAGKLVTKRFSDEFAHTAFCNTHVIETEGCDFE